MEKLRATGFWVELNRLTHADLPHLVRSARMLVPHAHAASTNIKYIEAYKRWQSWAKCQLVPALPACRLICLHVSLYLTFLTETTKSRIAIQAALYGIECAHTMCGSPDPTGHSLPTMVLEAAKRLLGKPPITSEMLKIWCKEHGNEAATLNDLRFIAMSLILFVGFLRLNELVNVRF